MTDIILCTYNGETYIREQLDSFLNQKVRADHIDVFDDCSRDDTRAILHEYADRMPEYISITERSTASGSASNNFLNAIAETDNKYDYYLLSDQDDIWNGNKIERLKKAISELESKHGKDTPVLVCSDASLIDETGRELAGSFVRFSGLRPDKDSLGELLLQNQYPGASFIFNRALKKRISSAPRNAMMHDHWLVLNAGCFGIIHYIDEPLYKYRQHSKNVLGAKTASPLTQFKNRMGFGSKSVTKMNSLANEYLQGTIKQAEEFLAVNEAELSDEQKKVIREYCSLTSVNKLERLRKIIRYNYTYNTLYRTMGEWVLS